VFVSACDAGRSSETELGGAPAAAGGLAAQNQGGSLATASGSGGRGESAGGGTNGSATSGDATNGGATNGGATNGGATNGGATFVLDWEDNFDSIDASLWELQTFSWDGNLAQFSTQNAVANSGILSIQLTPEATDTLKPYRGVELRSRKTITYGKVEAKVRFAKGSGVVSGLVLIYTPYPADDWNEIDIEHLGKSSNSVQLNCQVYTGPAPQLPVTQSVPPTQDPMIADLMLDTEADFHVYAMEWTPSDVRFTVDGKLLRTWTKDIARMKLAQNVLFTIWASNAANWAGPLTTSSAPTSADIDWIKVYRMQN